jgi:hypothetical protein
MIHKKNTSIEDPNNNANQDKKDKKGIFGKKNIGIKSKPRIVDATLTAYKLLESAYINQAGNPNELEK